MKSKKFGVMILFFNCENTILKTIENCAPFVDKIYIGYSEYPWNAYNKNAREKFKNNSDKSIIKLSKHYEKIDLIEGIWDTDEGQRNSILDKARLDDMDYIIFQDSDEFYLPSEYKKNIEGIINNPDFMMYQTPWITFWKSIDYAIIYKEHNGNKNTIYTTCSCFAMNLKKEPNTKLKFARVFDTNSIFQLKGICYHLSFVLSDLEVYSKINTWGHSQQVNKFWYKYKWLAWKPSLKNLSPFNSVEWVQAIKYNGNMPIELIDFPKLEQTQIELNVFEKTHSFLIDVNYLLIHELKYLYRKLKKIFKM